MAELLLVLSALSVVFGALVLRAFMPRVFAKDWGDPVLWMAIGFVAINAAWIVRSVYWDIAWFMMGNDPSEPSINITLNTVVIASQLCALKGRQLTIPESHRPPMYQLLRIACYPVEILHFRKGKRQ